MIATAIANSNIAFIKYWGKKDEDLIIPMNPSISMTLDSHVSTKTTVSFYNGKNEFILNGMIIEGNAFNRVKDHIGLIQARFKTSYNWRVVSENTFPTGAGIASSASGFAALSAAAVKALGRHISLSELSGIARQGSGSACRSVFPGIVEWGGDHAEQLFDENHWPELRDIIVIVSSEEKKISSREGMRLTIKKSRLYKDRMRTLPHRIKRIKTAIKQKSRDFFSIIMHDSDEMHSCCAEIGLNYLNDTSERIKKVIYSYNREDISAAYSFDAGPNAHIITTDGQVDELLELLRDIDGVHDCIVCRQGAGITYQEDHNDCKS